jgi:hypothetical protein
MPLQGSEMARVPNRRSWLDDWDDDDWDDGWGDDDKQEPEDVIASHLPDYLQWLAGRGQQQEDACQDDDDDWDDDDDDWYDDD